jgi:ATP-dependent RNA helicase RhlE
MSFNSLGYLMLYLKPSAKRVYNPISNTTKAIPPILEGKDVLASAQTGTGKQPVLHYLFCKYYHKVNNLTRPIRALILTTRELAAQYWPISKNTVNLDLKAP